MGIPSSSSEANASASACPQSIPPSTIVPRRRSSCFASFGLIVNPSGTRRSSSLSARRRSASTAVSTASPVPALGSGSGCGAGGSAIDARRLCVGSAQRLGDLRHELLRVLGA